MDGDTPVRLTADTAMSLGRSATFTRQLNRGDVNRMRSRPFAHFDGDRPQFVVKVTQPPGLSVGQSGAEGLWGGRIQAMSYEANELAWANEDQFERVFIAPLEGQEITLNMEAGAFAVDEVQGRTVYALMAGVAAATAGDTGGYCCDLARLCVRIEDQYGFVARFTLNANSLGLPSNNNPPEEYAAWGLHWWESQTNPPAINARRRGVLSHMIGYVDDPVSGYDRFDSLGSIGGGDVAPVLERIGNPSSATLPQWRLRFKLIGRGKYEQCDSFRYWKLEPQYDKTISWGGFPIEFGEMVPTNAAPVRPVNTPIAITPTAEFRWPTLRVRITAGECDENFQYRCTTYTDPNSGSTCIVHPSDATDDFVECAWDWYNFNANILPPGSVPQNFVPGVGQSSYTGCLNVCGPSSSPPPPPNPPTCPPGQFWNGQACVDDPEPGPGGFYCVSAANSPNSWSCFGFSGAPGSGWITHSGPHQDSMACWVYCATPSRYTCTQDGCIADANGEYDSLASCQNGQTGQSPVAACLNGGETGPLTAPVSRALPLPMCANLGVVLQRAAGCNAGPRCTWSCTSTNPGVRGHQGATEGELLQVVPVRDCDGDCPGYQARGAESV
jgi:hypothetical protein